MRSVDAGAGVGDGVAAAETSQKELFSHQDLNRVKISKLPKGSKKSPKERENLKHRYWSKSITSGWRRAAWKTVRMALFFVGTAGLNAYTQEKILGHHRDVGLPEPCIDLIKTGAGWGSSALVPLMVFMAFCTCASNVVARAKAFGSNHEGFCAENGLSSEQKCCLLLIEKAFLKLVHLPCDAENLFYISKDDIKFFGKKVFQDYMDLMYTNTKFRIVKDKKDLDNILNTCYGEPASNSSSCGSSPRSLASLPSEQSKLNKYNIIVFNDEVIPTRNLITSTYRIIPINLKIRKFDWSNFPQEIKRVVVQPGLSGNATRLWHAFLWVLFKGFPAFQVILQLSKALHSLEKVFGLKDSSPWVMHVICFSFNLAVAFNRALINNEMKGNEIYRLIDKRNTYKTYKLFSEEKQRGPRIKAMAASFLPVVVTILYLAFTSLFFAREGPISLAKQASAVFPWVDRFDLNSGSKTFLLNFITYGAVISGLAIGIPTQCRAIYKEFYRYFSKPKAVLGESSESEDVVRVRGNSGKGRFYCSNHTLGLAAFYFATFFDSAGYALNAFYNSMQAMLAPSQLFITNALGGCAFILPLAATVAIGIAATSLAWTKYNGDKKYKSFMRLWTREASSSTEGGEEKFKLPLEGLSREGLPLFSNRSGGSSVSRGSPQRNLSGRFTPRASPKQ